MAGEFAVQSGRLDEAADWYLQAARSADGYAGLAERATHISLMTKDDARTTAALRLWRERAPDSLAMMAAGVTLSLRKDDPRAARRQVEALLRTGGDDAWRYAVLALGAGSGNSKATARVLGQLVDSGAVPEDLQAWLVLGGLAQRLGDEALTERIVDKVIRHFPDEPRVALLRATQLREAGKPDQARDVLAKLARVDPMATDLRLSVAVEYNALGDTREAAAVLARGPQDDQVYRLRASLLADADDKQALGAMYDELKQDSASPD